MFRTTKRSEMRYCGTRGLDLQTWALEKAIPHNCPKFIRSCRTMLATVASKICSTVRCRDLKSWVLQKAPRHTSHEVPLMSQTIDVNDLFQLVLLSGRKQSTTISLTRYHSLSYRPATIAALTSSIPITLHPMTHCLSRNRIGVDATVCNCDRCPIGQSIGASTRSVV